MSRDFSQVLAQAKAFPVQKAAVVSPEEENTLWGIEEARKAGLVAPILLGDEGKLRKLAAKLDLALSNYQLIPCRNAEDSASQGVDLCRNGQADLLVKGFLPTPTFLRAVLHKERGIASGKLLSHVAIFQLNSMDRLLFLSDGGMVVLPTLQQKLEILKNALEVCHALGIAEPKVAVLASVETVSEELPATTDAAILAMMWQRKQIKGCILDGPLALDNAINPEALKEKAIDSPVGGCADLLLVPNIESGNLLGKSLVHFGGGLMAGAIQGARVPIVLVSRVDPPESKLYSIAVSTLIACRRKDS
ncbi:MAG: bifunctional enoyl-CoA hydratase/phosphate acetyltransferase [bacterium]|nr:bifunctional enoyl-CoA hydratase/phosphate acetyltransferase [Coprothermobacterota bacterium]